jgi:hypothetical protein
MKKQEVIEAINDFAAHCEELDTDLGGSHAEYVSSMGYGDAWHDFSLSEIEDDAVTDALEALQKQDQKAFQSLILENSDVVHCGMRLLGNEVFSIILGELEHELDGSLVDAFDALSGEEQEEVSKKVNTYLKRGRIYVDHGCDRMALVLDVDAVREKLNIEG